MYALIFWTLRLCRRLIKYKECVSFVFFVHRVSRLAANRLLPQTARFWDSLHCWRHHRLLHGGHRHQRSPVDAARQDWYRLGFLFYTSNAPTSALTSRFLDGFLIVKVLWFVHIINKQKNSLRFPPLVAAQRRYCVTAASVHISPLPYCFIKLKLLAYNYD